MEFTAARGAPVEKSLEKGRPFPTIHVLKKFVYYIAQRPTKRRRAPTTHSIKFRVTISSEDRLLRNPLAFFLALAFADDAIKRVSSVEQFWEIRPRRGQKSFQLEWNKEKLDTPVFRMVNATGPTPDA
ncbi:MAG: hypothetical protein Q9223_005718 [Gallowayella weberi]